MGCTQSRSVASDATYPNPNRHKLDHYGGSLTPEQHPESTKSSNTAGSTTSNSSSTDSFSYSTTPPINSTTTAFDFEYEIPVVYEMTTEDDADMVHAINRLEDRLTLDTPVKKRRSPQYEEVEEFLTDDFYEEVPNMDDYLNRSIESSALVVPPRHNLNYSRYAKLVDEEVSAADRTNESVEDEFHRRSLAVHAEQQKRLSVIHMLLPWTHAIAVRKQRHVHSRQFLRSSFVGLSMLMWPQMMSPKNRPTKIRTYNPTSLFRR